MGLKKIVHEVVRGGAHGEGGREGLRIRLDQNVLYARAKFSNGKKVALLDGIKLAPSQLGHLKIL